MTSSRSSAASHRGLSISVAAQAWAALAALAAFPILARGLGVVDRGRFAFVLAISEIGTLLFKMGLPEAAAFCDKEHLGNQRSILREVRRSAYWLLPLSMAAGLATYALILDDYPTAIRVIGSIAVAQSPLLDTLSLSRVRLMVSRGDARGIALNTGVPNTFLLVALIIFNAAGHITLFTTVLCAYAANIAGYLVAYWRIRPSRDHVEQVPELTKFAVRNAPYSMMEAVNLRLDQVALPIIAGPAQLGIYAVATSLTAPISRVGLAASASFYSTVQLTSPDRGRSDAGAAFRRSAVLVIGVSILAMLFAPLAIYLLAGDAYSGAIVLTIFLAVAWCLFAMAVVAANLLGALGDPGAASGSQAVGLVVTLLLLIPAIELFGARGAAIASLLSYLVRLAYCVRALRNRDVPNLKPQRADVMWVIGPFRSAFFKLVRRET